ncbi:EAL domain-containing protein [Cohnella caldifontis]|uniref:EAL domain-containing protein n=1 Tax=Cohnella caldifontis TaxID=3027471 RepID=UPI0023EBC5E6|nr:EAL domain-containing protein [Cohnella sp. YIM B05605]
MPSTHPASDRPLPFRDRGSVEFAADDWTARPNLRRLVRDMVQSSGGSLSLDRQTLRYDSGQALLRLIHGLQADLLPDERSGVRFRRVGEAPEPAWLLLASLFEEVGGRSVSEYILHRSFTTYLQPIVQPSGRIVGYECLLRPLPEQAPYRPAELFAKARQTGLHSFLDRQARQAAIRVSSAHLTPGVKRFVNFLPSSLYGDDAGVEDTFEAMRVTGTDPGDVVFEVVETEPLDHPDLPAVIDRCRREGILLAVDDVGTGYATAEAIDRLKPDYVKLDRRFVHRCESDAGKQRQIDELLGRASRFNGVVLAEGVEREEERDYLRRAGVPLLQGYLFGPAAPVPAVEPAAFVPAGP